jgi:hypothetical protein
MIPGVYKILSQNNKPAGFRNAVVSCVPVGNMLHLPVTQFLWLSLAAVPPRDEQDHTSGCAAHLSLTPLCRPVYKFAAPMDDIFQAKTSPPYARLILHRWRLTRTSKEIL